MQRNTTTTNAVAMHVALMQHPKAEAGLQIWSIVLHGRCIDATHSGGISGAALVLHRHNVKRLFSPEFAGLYMLEAKAEDPELEAGPGRADANCQISRFSTEFDSIYQHHV